MQPIAREALDQAVTPLDNRDRLLERRVEVEVVDFRDRRQPVGVNVHQR